jgi:alpha-methylacyl-CoA racemase
MTALEGLRVLDVTRLLPGGFCTQLFADLGATVTKVEDTAVGDYLRWSPPEYSGADPTTNSALFLWLNRGKRSVRIDLKNPRGRELLLEAVRETDVLIESFRPDVMERLGLSYDELKQVNPALVYCSISGYGHDSPYRDRSGHDTNYLALSGMVAMTGSPDGPPVQPAGQLADIGAALLAAVGILAALRERDHSGQGQRVDVSLFDASVLWLGMVVAKTLCDGEPPRRGLTEQAICYRVYRCQDGWVTLAALEPKFWAAFCQGIGREDLLPNQFDVSGSPAHAALEEVFAHRTRAAWQEFGDRHDCCLEPVLELDEALASPLVGKLVSELAQPGTQTPVRHLGPPVHLSRTRATPQGPAPTLGEHTRDTLAALGLSQETISELEDAGVIATSGTPSATKFMAR